MDYLPSEQAGWWPRPACRRGRRVAAAGVWPRPWPPSVAAAGLSRGAVSLIERGHLDSVSLRTLRAVAGAVEVRVSIGAQWRGGDLPRLLNRRHSAMHEAIAVRFERLRGWTYRPEVSFSIFGERGIIDALAWHEASRSLLVIELKSEIVDVQELIGTMDRRRRLAPDIVCDLGWRAGSVGAWVIVADGRTNRRHAAGHRAVLRAAFPSDGHAVAGWLREPAGPMAALSFLPDAHGGGTRRGIVPVRRVRRSATAGVRVASEPGEHGRAGKRAAGVAVGRLTDPAQADDAGHAG